LGVVVGGLLALVGMLLFFGLMTGGLAYRKDCVTQEGTVKHDWVFQWAQPLPYLFRPSQPGCAVHTGTRVALDEIGLFPFTDNPGRIAAKSGGSAAGSDVAYYDNVFAVLTDIANQVKAGGLLRAPSDYLQRKRESVERLNPPSYLAPQQAALLREFRQLEADLRVAIAANARRDTAKLDALGRKGERDILAMLHTGEAIRSAVVESHRSQ
jgi:hypothetical protein